MEEQHEIKQLILKQLLGESNDDEDELIRKWRNNGANNEALYQKVIQKERIAKSFDVYQSINTDAAFVRVNTLAGRTKHLLPRFLKYTAAITIPLLIGLSVWLISDIEQKPLTTTGAIVSGSKKTMLQLSDGSEVELSAGTSSFALKERGKVVGHDSLNILIYSRINSDELRYNTMKVPRGGEYQLHLSDGTKVWLNSETDLRFPVNFVGDTREVYLKGEAYFEVAHDISKPFIVYTNHAKVKVYGTVFNARNYTDEKVEQLTLLEGSIGVEANGQQTMIRPGEQAELTAGGEKLVVKEVDTSYYAGWITGKMKFKNMSLRELSKQITRWYDVDFSFANNRVAELRFSGNFDRDCEFQLLLELLERTTKVKIELDGRTVVVKELL